MSIIEKTIRTKLTCTGTGKDAPTHEITVKMDFSECDGDDILAWAAKDRVIVFQNNNRKHMSVEEYKALNGQTLDVNEMCKGRGRSVITRPMTMEEQIAHIQNLPEDERGDYIAKLTAMMTGE